MSKKRVEKLYCYNCDSEFKLIFNEEEVSHLPTVCPFCAEDIDFDNQDDCKYL